VTSKITPLADAVRSGDRAALARAITLIESRRADHQAQARDLVQELLPLTGNAIRVGITGSPGVGKSTTIDALGMALIGKGHKVAVLAVDPSSARTGGSILGDKTRMARLSAEADAFIRPLAIVRHPLAASRPRRARRCCSVKPQVSMWCWWRLSASDNLKPPSAI
jgi:LAO/AO transport system kinase